MKILNTAHLAFNVSDMEKSLHFYCDCLGLKQKLLLNFDFNMEDESLKESYAKVEVSEELRKRYEAMMGKPWITYVEVAPHQYIELFYTYSPMDKKLNDDSQIGYLHLSLEVDNIKEAREELIAKGVQPTTEIALGPDHTYQMWIADPDGNRIELMEYTDRSLQLVGNL